MFIQINNSIFFLLVFRAVAYQSGYGSIVRSGSKISKVIWHSWAESYWAPSSYVLLTWAPVAPTSRERVQGAWIYTRVGYRDVAECWGKAMGGLYVYVHSSGCETSLQCHGDRLCWFHYICVRLQSYCLTQSQLEHILEPMIVIVPLKARHVGDCTR